jgi:hypothetical protein
MKGSGMPENTPAEWTVEEIVTEEGCQPDPATRLVRLSPSGSYDFNELEVGQVLVVKESA